MSFENLFTRARKDRVTTIEASVRTYDDIALAYYDGMYTVKNINPPTSDDLFYFFPSNIVPGYLESSHAKTMSLINGRKKLIKSICNSFYHAVLDDLSEILYALSKHPDHDLIIDISDIYHSLYAPNAEWDFFNFFVQTLKENGTDVKLVQLKQYDIIYIDNFRLLEFVYESGKKSNLIYEFIAKKVSDPSVKPTKNVFVSRAAIPPRDDIDPKHSQGLSYVNDRRMDDHIALENYFADLGYEIVHAEKFASFQQQIDYFYSAKTIASITGSGLTNAAFMQPGGTMFEIVTPLVVTVPPPGAAKDITNPFYVQEVHNFYKNLAFYQDHTFACVQNSSRSFEEFKQKIEGDPKLKAFLDRND